MTFNAFGDPAGGFSPKGNPRRPMVGGALPSLIGSFLAFYREGVKGSLRQNKIKFRKSTKFFFALPLTSIVFLFGVNQTATQAWWTR